MRPTLAEEEAKELAGWSEPIIGDVIAAGYMRAIGDHGAMAALIRCHVLLWRSLLRGSSDIGPFTRDLGRLAARAELDARHIEALNRHVLRELMHVIAERYARTPRVAAQLSFHVAGAACRLSEASPRAAAGLRA